LHKSSDIKLGTEDENNEDYDGDDEENEKDEKKGDD
jgi:hypothetical protein